MVVVAQILHPSQVRWYATSALIAFDTLSADDAIAVCKSELLDLLDYIDRLHGTDDAVSVFSAVPIKARIGDELEIRDHQTSDTADLEITRP